MIKLSIPRLPESYNKVVKFSGWKRQEYRQGWHDEVWFCWRYYQDDHKIPKLPFKKAKVTFIIYFGDKKHRDKTNIAGGLKYALDALTEHWQTDKRTGIRIKTGLGIMEDDENYPERKCDDYYVLTYDKKYPRTEIQIEKGK